MTNWNRETEPPKDLPILVELADGQKAVMKYEDDIEKWTTQGWEDCHYCGGQSQADMEEHSHISCYKQIVAWCDVP